MGSGITVRSLDPGEDGFPEREGEWRFVAENQSRRIGGVTLSVAPTTSDPAWLGTLPSHEITASGFDLPWDGDYLEIGSRLLTGAAGAMGDTVPDQVQARVNRDYHDHVEERRALLEGSGLNLFQEKRGFLWVDDGTPIEVSPRLAFVTVEEIGTAAFAAVMGRCGEGTLDRNDRYYWGGCGAENWAAQMMVYLGPGDAAMWLVGLRGTDPVGFIAIGSDADWGATIIHIGVVPEHRGRGHIDDLLAAGTLSAQKAGIATMLSDVDTLNQPMAAAMRRNRHMDHNPWHVWDYRGRFVSP
jgi:ribosomal protein S18 acetylase RimI-like enzyme